MARALIFNFCDNDYSRSYEPAFRLVIAQLYDLQARAPRIVPATLEGVIRQLGDDKFCRLVTRTSQALRVLQSLDRALDASISGGGDARYCDYLNPPTAVAAPGEKQKGRKRRTTQWHSESNHAAEVQSDLHYTEQLKVKLIWLEEGQSSPWSGWHLISLDLATGEIQLPAQEQF